MFGACLCRFYNICSAKAIHHSSFRPTNSRFLTFALIAFRFCQTHFNKYTSNKHTIHVIKNSNALSNNAQLDLCTFYVCVSPAVVFLLLMSLLHYKCKLCVRKAT